MATHRLTTLFPPPDPKTLRLLAVCAFICALLRFHFVYTAGQTFLEPGRDIDVPASNRTALTSQEVDVHATDNAPLPASEFPRKIWQTSKFDAGSLAEDDQKVIQSWLKLNPKHRYEIMTKFSAETYIKEKFSHRPDVIETFLDLQEPILRADFIRYLVLLGDGGVYSDIDTRCHVSIDDWVPSEYRGKVSLVVGIEFDGRGELRWGDWTRDLQFASWAVLAKPGHLGLQVAVDKAVTELRKLAQKQETTVSGLKPSFREILDATGPAMFTDSVLESLATLTGTEFTWRNVSGLTAPVLIADVLVLPINGFGAGQLHSNSGDPEGKDVLVHHLFKGSWKADHPYQTIDKERDYEAEKKKKEEEETAKKTDSNSTPQADAPAPVEEQQKAEEAAGEQQQKATGEEQKPLRRRRR